MNAPARLWILIDRSNGGCGYGPGRNYCWFFNTREEAREHKRDQAAHPNNAKLEGPYPYKLVK